VYRFVALPAGLIWLGLGVVAPPAPAQTTSGATFGDVIQLQGGTPSDVVLDELRHCLYLVNNNSQQVKILDYTTSQTVGTIQVGTRPISAAMSMDGNWLYVASGVTTAQVASGTPVLSVVDLSQGRVVQTQTLPSAPQGVEVGSDGRVLVSMLGSGVVAGVPQGTLGVFDRTQATTSSAFQLVNVPALPTTPAPLPPTTLTRPVLTFTGRLLRTPDGSLIVGVITPTAFHLHFCVRSGFGSGIAEPDDFGGVVGAFDVAGRVAVHGRVHNVRYGDPGCAGPAE
jgi:hypothetical protein